MSIQQLSKHKIDITKDYADDGFEPFPCIACGQCCRNVHLSPLTNYLSRGDGVCQYLDEDSNLCSIYEERPIFCNITNFFKIYLSDKILWTDFVEQNLVICRTLQYKD